MHHSIGLGDANEFDTEGEFANTEPASNEAPQCVRWVQGGEAGRDPSLGDLKDAADPRVMLGYCVEVSWR